MNFAEAVFRALSGGDVRFALMNWPATMSNHVWIMGGSDDGGTGPVVARGHLWQYIMPCRVCVGRRPLVAGRMMGR